MGLLEWHQNTALCSRRERGPKTCFLGKFVDKRRAVYDYCGNFTTTSAHHLMAMINPSSEQTQTNCAEFVKILDIFSLCGCAFSLF
jgi:hypothetical protein